MSQRYGLVRYLTGAVCARTGDETSGPALLLWGMALTGAVGAGSALLAGLTAAAAVGGPLVGVVLDRSSRPGRLLAAALAVYAAGLAAAALALGRLPLPLVVAGTLAVGLVGPVLSGGWTAQLPRVVAPGRLPRASAWDAMTFGAAGLLGPALAGVAAAVSGAGAAVAAAVLLLALAVPAAWTLPGRAPRRAVSGPVAADLLRGVRAVLGNRALLRVTAVTAVSVAGTGMLVVCAPVAGLRLLGSQESGALLLSGMAVCSLLANLVLARRPPRARPDTVVLACVLVQAAGTALAALASSPALLLAGAALVGAAEGPQLASLFAVRHREAPEHLRSQVFTTGASLKISAFALGAAVAGPLAEVSVPVCLAVAAGIQAVAALVYAGIRVGAGPQPSSTPGRLRA
ncbi:hypothetical protein A6A08_18510 [Nocardiopsis sp. TSRI0078]|uniref:MFS transporter n=1 Tax=unclassified Nocardiopsis TaxID=2649073 RepID=UPI00093F2A7A|nr:MFS transporter [Nocardiopsis sp. TSRI0078]OKI22938.1 hypothetical protein A6A08_18510 [Nocardiopsis sp. TSRI0078]